MAYFTTILQHQVDDVWRKKIEAADQQMRLCTSGKAIRDYLNDKKTLNTVGFVIRRHLQNEYKPLLDEISSRTGCGYADLSKNLNVTWPDVFINDLAGELFKISKAQGIAISKITWTRYLSDAPNKMYKDTPFKVAFSLKMNTETTEDLLMACGQDSYCFRKPEHFIYYYAQQRPEYYTWTHAQALLNKYKMATENSSATINDSSLGMTNILRRDLKALFLQNGSNEQCDNDLITYMVQHHEEFSGLSISNREDFLRMAKYLVVLYPTFARAVSKKNPVTGEIIEDVIDVPVTISEDGNPQLSELVRALFSTGGWLPTSFGKTDNADNLKRTASSLKRRESSENIEYKRAAINEGDDQPFLNAVQFFVDSYAHHLDAIDRVFRCPANPGSVERRDVILFTYFFIRKYPELLENEGLYGDELDGLTSLAYSDSRVDRAMDDIMEQLYDIVNDEDDNEKDRVLSYLGIFNDMLRAFGMKEMYMPNTWDRFIYMSLFTEDPDIFTEAVLWNTISDDESEGEQAELPKEGNVPQSSAGQARLEKTLTEQSCAEQLPAGQARFEKTLTEQSCAEQLPTGRARFEKTLTEQLPSAETVRNLVESTNPDYHCSMTAKLTSSSIPRQLIIDNPGSMPIKNANGQPEYTVAYFRRVSNDEYITINKCCFIVGRRDFSARGPFQDYGLATPDMTISRCQLLLTYSNEAFYISDISSRNETLLNTKHLKGCKVKVVPNAPVNVSAAYPLKNGDVVSFGSEELIFVIPD